MRSCQPVRRTRATQPLQLVRVARSMVLRWSEQLPQRSQARTAAGRNTKRAPPGRVSHVSPVLDRKVPPRSPAGGDDGGINTRNDASELVAGGAGTGRQVHRGRGRPRWRRTPGRRRDGEGPGLRSPLGIARNRLRLRPALGRSELGRPRRTREVPETQEPLRGVLMHPSRSQVRLRRLPPPHLIHLGSHRSQR
jgi:hypothetical protein